MSVLWLLTLSLFDFSTIGSQTNEDQQKLTLCNPSMSTPQEQHHARSSEWLRG
jgi:hypothetical protein